MGQFSAGCCRYAPNFSQLKLAPAWGVRLLGIAMHNGEFWSPIFINDYIPQYELLMDTLKNRLLPTFANVDDEAKEKTSKEWERLNQECFDPNIDGSDLAEWAENAGINHYLNMTSMEQALTNMFAMTLYHIFEQHMMEFHRREVLNHQKRSDNKYFKQKIFKDALKNNGVDIESFSSWKDIEELRHLANTVKHADGSSSEKLYELNKDLFNSDFIQNSDDFSFLGDTKPSVYKPLTGDDFYVRVGDIQRYCDSLSLFWHQLATAISGENEA